jgi:hypothetical protein
MPRGEISILITFSEIIKTWGCSESRSVNNYKHLVLLCAITLIILGCQPNANQTPTQEWDPPGAPQEITPIPTNTVPAEEGTVITPTPSPDVMHPPSPPESPIQGVEIHRNSSLELVTQSGAHWLRRNALLWSEIEPEEGLRDWATQSILEEELIAAAELGHEVILIVRSTPSWAQKIPGYYCGPIAEDKLSSFAEFINDAVARYSTPPFNVKYWEFWNEPDVAHELVPPDMVFGCWGDSQDPYYGGGYYAEMLKTVYPLVKASHPDAQVVVGGLLLDCNPVNPPETEPGSGEFRSCLSSQFLEGVLMNDGGDSFDGVSFHAYDYFAFEHGKYANLGWNSTWDSTGPVLAAKTNYLRNLLSEHGYVDKFLMNTEVALICGSTGREPECQTEDFEMTKAMYVIQSYTSALAEGLTANIWYSITGWRGSGLIRDGELLPAFETYQVVAEMLSDQAFVQRLDLFSDVAGYELYRDGVVTWVLWALSDEPKMVTLPREPRAIFDAFGIPLERSREIVLTASPVFVEFVDE